MDNSEIPQVGDLIIVSPRGWVGYVTRLDWEGRYECCWIKWSDETHAIRNFVFATQRKIRMGQWKLIKSHKSET